MILKLKFDWAVDRRTAVISSLYRGEVLPSQGEWHFESGPDDPSWPVARRIATDLVDQADIYLDCRQQLISIYLREQLEVRSWLYQQILDNTSPVLVLEALARVSGARRYED